MRHISQMQSSLTLCLFLSEQLFMLYIPCFNSRLLKVNCVRTTILVMKLYSDPMSTI